LWVGGRKLAGISPLLSPKAGREEGNEGVVWDTGRGP